MGETNKAQIVFSKECSPFNKPKNAKLREFELQKAQQVKNGVELERKVEIMQQQKSEHEKEEMRINEEKIARQKLEEEKQKILEDEKIRIAQLEKEKLVLQ